MSAGFWILSATLILAAASWLRRRRGFIEMAAVLTCGLPLFAWTISQLGLAPLMSSSLPNVWPEAEGSSLNGLAWIWMTGVLVTGSRLLIGLVVLSRWRRRAVPLDPLSIQKIASLLESPADDVEAYVRISDEISSPMVVPGWPSKVLVPKDWSQWEEDLQSASLHHEWHHLKQHDGWRTLALAIFLTAWWFHPLAHWLRRCWQEQTEFEADEAAAQRCDVAAYASALLEFASPSRKQSLAPVLSVGFALSKRKRLHRRIEAILDSASRSTKSLHSPYRSAHCAALLITLTAFLSWSGCKPSAPHTNSDAHEKEARLRLTAEPFPADS